MADESLCRRCGRCCHKKLDIGGVVYMTPFPCRYLDEETNLCKVYDRRHEVNPDCLGVEEGIKRHAFPADCPYVRGLKGYVPPIEEPPAKGAERFFDLLADELGVGPEERERYKARWKVRGKGKGRRREASSPD
ncbi:MAG: hypothetical protein N3A38_11885 [Planctomycetota bacterium]|nr:hypothetical protein [Planctomycetota bacterium]